MADATQIEWTDSTWNPVTGCSKITAGCDSCYAERFAERFRGVAGHPFENGFDLTLRPEILAQPMQWRRPRRIFVNSMSDLFHKEVPKSFIDAVFDTMEAADWHTYQVLTKRSSLMARYLRNRYPSDHAPAHIWLGVSVESARYVARIRHLQAAPAAVRFISFEPLLAAIGVVDLSGIQWGRWRNNRTMRRRKTDSLSMQRKSASPKSWYAKTRISSPEIFRLPKWNDLRDVPAREAR